MVMEEISFILHFCLLCPKTNCRHLQSARKQLEEQSEEIHLLLEQYDKQKRDHEARVRRLTAVLTEMQTIS